MPRKRPFTTDSRPSASKKDTPPPEKGLLNEPVRLKNAGGAGPAHPRTARKDRKGEEGSLTHFLREFVGGKEAVMRYFRHYADRGGSKPSTRRLVELWDSLTRRQRETITYEKLCVMAAVPREDFIAAVTAGVYASNLDGAQMIAALEAPNVIKAMAAQALTPEGQQERMALLRIAGVQGTETGPQTVINNTNNVRAMGGTAQAVGLPPMESSAHLVASATRGLVVEGEVVDLPALTQGPPSDDPDGPTE